MRPRAALRELALYAAGCLPILLVARAAVLVAHLGHGQALVWHPALLGGDLACLALMCGLAVLWPARVRLVLFATVLVLLAAALAAAVNYFTLYEAQFAWDHVQRWEGTGEMLTSIRGELTTGLLLAIPATIVFVSAWVWLARRHLPRTPAPGPWTERVSRLALGLFLAGGGLAGGQYLYVGPRGTDARDSARLARWEQLETLATNVPLELLVTFGAEPVREAPDGLRSVALRDSAREFQFRFPTGSLSAPDERRPGFSFPARGRKFNVVLYFFESTSAAYIGRMIGQRQLTPNWLRLSANSIRLRRHYTQGPLSINALFTVLTSAYGLPGDRWAAMDYPDIALRSLPEILHEAGYLTGVLHTGYFGYAGQGEFLRSRKFDMMRDVLSMRKPPYTEVVNWGIDDRAMIQPAAEFVRESARRRQPFFLVMLPVSPHHPYDVPPQDGARFSIVANPDTPVPVRDGHTARNFGRYLNSLHYSDHVLGETIAALEAAGAADDTLFFIFADHGEAFGQHRANYNHPFYVYEENVHVPFLIYNRRLFGQGAEFSAVSRHVDIVPTVLDMLAIPGDPRHEGVSLLRRGPAQIATFHTSWRNHLVGLRDGSFKYIYNLRTGTDELYDLSSDPEEKNPIEDRHGVLRARYRDFLAERQNYLRGYFERVVGAPIDWNAVQEKDEVVAAPAAVPEASPSQN